MNGLEKLFHKKAAVAINPALSGPYVDGSQVAESTRSEFDDAKDSSIQIHPAGISIALDTATTDFDLATAGITGNVLWAIWATDANVLVTIKYHSKNDFPLPVGKNFFLAGIRFEKLYMSWTAQAGKSITIVAINDPSKNQKVRIE